MRRMPALDACLIWVGRVVGGNRCGVNGGASTREGPELDFFTVCFFFVRFATTAFNHSFKV